MYVFRNRASGHFWHATRGGIRSVNKATKFVDLEPAQQCVSAIGSEWELVSTTELIQPKSLSNGIKFARGEHALGVGDIQSGKLWYTLKLIVEAIHVHKLPVLFLLGNSLSNLYQFLLRQSVFNDEQRLLGNKLLPQAHFLRDYPEPHQLADLFQDKRPNLVVGLAHYGNLALFDQCLTESKKIQNKIFVITDEADQVTFDLNEKQRSKTEKMLAKIFPKIFMHTSITATPTSILLCDQISQAYSLPIPEDYHGIARIPHTYVDSVRAWEDEGYRQYDPSLDIKTLHRIVDEIKNDEFTLLITSSLVCQDHFSTCATVGDLAKKHGLTNNDSVLMEMNGNSVKIYNLDMEKQDEISDKIYGKKVASIPKAIQQYKHKKGIIISAGHLASRCNAFFSTDGSRHLSHQYMVPSDTVHAETALQGIRIQGVYKKDPPKMLYINEKLHQVLNKWNSKVKELITAKIEKGQLPDVIRTLIDFGYGLTSKRKMKGTRFSLHSEDGQWEYYLDDYIVENPPYYVDTVRNYDENLAGHVLAGNWSRAFGSYAFAHVVSGKERVTYFNGRENDLRGEALTPNCHNYETIMELYRRFPQFENRVLRRRRTDTGVTSLVRKNDDGSTPSRHLPGTIPFPGSDSH